MHFFFTISTRAHIYIHHHKFDPNRPTHCRDIDLVESDFTYTVYVYTCESLTTTMGFPIEKKQVFTIHCGQTARWMVMKILSHDHSMVAYNVELVRCLNSDQFFRWKWKCVSLWDVPCERDVKLWLNLRGCMHFFLYISARGEVVNTMTYGTSLNSQPFTRCECVTLGKMPCEYQYVFTAASILSPLYSSSRQFWHIP